MPVFDQKNQIIYVSSVYLPLKSEHISAMSYVFSPSDNNEFFYFSKGGQRTKFHSWDELKKLYQLNGIELKDLQELRTLETIKEIGWNVFEKKSGEIYNFPSDKAVNLNALLKTTKTELFKHTSIKPSVSSLNKKVFKDHLGNEFPTKKAMSLYYDITPVVFAKRMSRGWSLEKTLTTPINPQLPEVKDHLGNKFNGKASMYKHYGVAQHVAERLLAAGFSLEDVLTKKAGVYNTGRIQTDHLGNNFKGLRAMCKHYGITVSVYYQRLRLGWSLEETLTTPIGDHTKKGVACKDHLGNSFESIGDMIEHYGVTRTAYSYRKKLGWSLEDILTKPLKSKTVVKDHLGNEYSSLQEMTSKYPCKTSSTYRSRLSSGMSVEEALMTPIAPRTYKSSRSCVDHLGNKFDTLKSMCEFYNIESNTYKSRIKKGMSVKEALTKPVAVKVRKKQKVKAKQK